MVADQAFPARLPNFDLLINLKAAKAVGFEIPTALRSPTRSFNRQIFCIRVLLHMLTAVPGTDRPFAALQRFRQLCDVFCRAGEATTTGGGDLGP